MSVSPYRWIPIQIRDTIMMDDGFIDNSIRESSEMNSKYARRSFLFPFIIPRLYPSSDKRITYIRHLNISQKIFRENLPLHNK